MKSKKKPEQQSTSMNADENQQNRENSSKELIKRRDIEGTPFVEVTDEEGNRFITMGSYRISKILDNRDWDPTGIMKIETAEEYLEENKWTILTTIVAIAVEKTLQQSKLQ